MRDDKPCAVDWNNVMPRKPVKVNPMKLNPADCPRFSCSVPPSRKIIRKGKTTAAIRRPGSRKNFSRSRPAIAAIAFSSGIFARQKPKVGLLQRCRLRSQHGQRLLDRMHHLISAASIETNHKVTVFAEGHFQRVQLPPEDTTVGGIDVQSLVNQL